MADLSVNVNDATTGHEDSGQNLVFNASFESAPSFTAVTTASAVWIDGTAAGSGTNDTYRWGVFSKTGSGAGSFDTSTSHSGSNSMKVSTTATGSRFQVANTDSTTLASLKKYTYAVYPGTKYIISGWMSTNYGSGDSSDGARLRFIEYNAAGTQGTVTNGTAIKTTTGWTQYSFSVTTASTAVMAVILLAVMGDTGTATLIMDAWFDDISLQSAIPNGNVTIPVGITVAPPNNMVSGPKIWS